ncbi:MAG: CheY-like chemotaxis protein, partial [Candidatus Marinamargulisbacteria bacterium]
SLELDIILMNIMLPKLNGYKVCQLIKFDEKFTHIPVILLSSRDKYLDADIIRDSGADVYFEKTASPSASFFANLVEQANQKTETTPLIQGL